MHAHVCVLGGATGTGPRDPHLLGQLWGHRWALLSPGLLCFATSLTLVN